MLHHLFFFLSNNTARFSTADTDIFMYDAVERCKCICFADCGGTLSPSQSFLSLSLYLFFSKQKRILTQKHTLTCALFFCLRETSLQHRFPKNHRCRSQIILQ